MGANIVVPGVNFTEIQTIKRRREVRRRARFLNLFSGGALARAAIFGLGIMPYITSSIIVQLLQTVIPKFEQWREQGAVGTAQAHPGHPLPHRRAGRHAELGPGVLVPQW